MQQRPYKSRGEEIQKVAFQPPTLLGHRTCFIFGDDGWTRDAEACAGRLTRSSDPSSSFTVKKTTTRVRLHYHRGLQGLFSLLSNEAVKTTVNCVKVPSGRSPTSFESGVPSKKRSRSSNFMGAGLSRQ